MNPKLKVGGVVFVVLGVAIFFQLQQAKMKRFVDENAELRTQRARMISLQESNQLLSANWQEAVAASRANLGELVRLRGQAVRLRQLEQENMLLRSQVRRPEQQLVELESALADYTSIINNGARRLGMVKRAIEYYYANHGSLPPITDSVEPTLAGEGLLEESIASPFNIRTRIVEISDSMAPVTAANQAYSLDGNRTNVVFGAVLVEAVIANATATAAQALSLRVDGEALSSPVGEADLAGRVKFDAIPVGGSGEVHCYLTHR